MHPFVFKTVHRARTNLRSVTAQRGGMSFGCSPGTALLLALTLAMGGCAATPAASSSSPAHLDPVGRVGDAAGSGGADSGGAAASGGSAGGGAASGTARALEPPPIAVKEPITDEYHGVKVVDDYRWLENFNDPAVKQWVADENRFSRTVLEQIPGREAIGRKLREYVDTSSAAYFGLVHRGERFFCFKFQPPAEQPRLISLASPDDPASEKILLDPNKLSEKGHTSIDWFVPSLDGRLIAVSLSQGGSEAGVVHVYETATGRELADQIPRVQVGTSGGSLSWNGDGTGFYYTRHPLGEERPPEDRDFYEQIYFHRLGTPMSADTYCIGRDFPRIAEVTLTTRDDGAWILAEVENGDGNEYAHFLKGPSGAWTQLTHFSDKIVKAAFGPDDSLYLLSLDQAPRGKVLRLPLAKLELTAAQPVIPQSEKVIQRFTPTEHRIFVVDSIGGPNDLRVFDLKGQLQATVPVLPVSSVGQLAHVRGDEVLFYNSSFLEPGAWFRYTSAGEVKRTALTARSPVNFSDIEVVQELAISRDGTKVPLSILRRKGLKLDGRNPTLLTGYGGFDVSLPPRFDPTARIYFDRGMVVVVANLRGGGEFGEEWHLAGNLLRKQNVFDDFIGCAQHLIDAGYTRPEHLAIAGGSNGGLLMGAVITQRPDLFRTVVASVGIYDMLRNELTPNGFFNTSEYGSVKDPEQFKALYAYSPYHHVVDGTQYPSMLFTTGDNDPRVDPFHSRKMVARLQVAQASGSRPILLKTSSSAGHGIGTGLSEALALKADMMAFVIDQLGLNPPSSP